MARILTFDDAINATKDTDRSLLIGNGFSAKYFNYADLFEKSGIANGSSIDSLFKELNTLDFEFVIRRLEEAANVAQTYQNQSHANELMADASSVRRALVNAVTETHPQHRSDLAFDYESSSRFLQNFRKVFTLNYDLLLYWVNLEKSILRDGFGLGQNIDEFRGPFSLTADCTIFNLHGGLHLFQQSDGTLWKRLDCGAGVIPGIVNTIMHTTKLPLYVAEGTSQAKMKKIYSVEYLRHCYEQLCRNESTLFVYGHRASENDIHIYDAIFKSNIDHIYFGIYQPTNDRLREFEGRLANYRSRSSGEIGYSFFDSESANVWQDSDHCGLDSILATNSFIGTSQGEGEAAFSQK